MKKLVLSAVPAVALMFAVGCKKQEAVQTSAEQPVATQEAAPAQPAAVQSPAPAPQAPAAKK